MTAEECSRLASLEGKSIFSDPERVEYTVEKVEVGSFVRIAARTRKRKSTFPWQMVRAASELTDLRNDALKVAIGKPGYRECSPLRALVLAMQAA